MPDAQEPQPKSAAVKAARPPGLPRRPLPIISRGDESKPTGPLIQPIAVLTTTIIIGFLFFARDVFVPLALAVLLSFLLAAPCAWLERKGLPRSLAVIFVVGVTCVMVAAIAFLVTSQFYGLAKTLPRYSAVIEKKLKALNVSPNGTLGQLNAMLTRTAEALQPASKVALTNSLETNETATASLPAAPPVPVEVLPAHEGTYTLLWSFTEPVLKPMGTALVILVVLIFMLYSREDLRNRLIRLAGIERMDITTDAMGEAAQRVSRYISMQLIVNCCFGVLIGTGLYFIGVPSPWLWGVMALLLRFIPYVGPWIAAFPPLLLAFAVAPGWGKAAEALSLFAAVELITSNAVEPWLYGASTGVSPVALLLAAIFWTWLWGPVGLLLSTPLTVCLAVIGLYLPHLRFLHVLLGDEPVLSLETRFYQRLRAMDRYGAEAILDAFLTEKSLSQAYQDVLLPALAYAKEDSSLGRLNAEKEKFIFDSIAELAQELGDEQSDGSGQQQPSDQGAGLTSPSRTASVAIIPAKGIADEIAGEMFKRILEQRGLRTDTWPASSIVTGALDSLAANSVGTLCISVVPPSALRRARYLCKKIRLIHPEIKIVLGFWSGASELPAIQENLTSCKADQIATSFERAAAAVLSLSVKQVGPNTTR